MIIGQFSQYFPNMAHITSVIFSHQTILNKFMRDEQVVASGLEFRTEGCRIKSHLLLHIPIGLVSKLAPDLSRKVNKVTPCSSLLFGYQLRDHLSLSEAKL